jgi:hypothetical protein
VQVRIKGIAITIEKARYRPERANVIDTVEPFHVVPGPEGPSLSRVLGELLFHVRQPGLTAFRSRLLAEFGPAAFAEYLDIDVQRAWLLSDWLVRYMAPTWFRWDERDDLASVLESLPVLDGQASRVEEAAGQLAAVSSLVSYNNIPTSRIFAPASVHSQSALEAVRSVMSPPAPVLRAIRMAYAAGFHAAEDKVPGFLTDQFRREKAAQVELLAQPVVDQLDQSLASVVREARTRPPFRIPPSQSQ